MNARILSIAAFAAFASLGAQAAGLNNGMSGDVPADFVAATQSVNSRATVQAQAANAIVQSQFKNYQVVDTSPAATATALTRDEVRQDAAYAVRSGNLATGDLS